MVHRHASWHPETTTACREATKAATGFAWYEDAKEDDAPSDAGPVEESRGEDDPPEAE